MKYSSNQYFFYELRKFSYICKPIAEIAQLVERWLPKPKVAGPSPVFRSTYSNDCKSIIY